MILNAFNFMQVMGVTFDGASINWRIVRLHHSERKLLYKTHNPYADDGRVFFLF